MSYILSSREANFFAVDLFIIFETTSSTFAFYKKYFSWAVVVVQLVERSLPKPEVRGLNPVIGKIDAEHLFTAYYRLC